LSTNPIRNTESLTGSVKVASLKLMFSLYYGSKVTEGVIPKLSTTLVKEAESLTGNVVVCVVFITAVESQKAWPNCSQL
jgi:hypothetical protein